MKITKDRVKNIVIGAVVGGVVGVVGGVCIAVTGVGGKISKQAFKAGAMMVGCRTGYGNITGYVNGESRMFETLNQFEAYIDDLYEEYLDQ